MKFDPCEYCDQDYPCETCDLPECYINSPCQCCDKIESTKSVTKKLHHQEAKEYTNKYKNTRQKSNARQ